MPLTGVASPLLEFGRVEELDGEPSSSVGRLVKRCEVDDHGSVEADGGIVGGILPDRGRGWRGRENEDGGGGPDLAR